MTRSQFLSTTSLTGFQKREKKRPAAAPCRVDLKVFLVVLFSLEKDLKVFLVTVFSQVSLVKALNSKALNSALLGAVPS